eukprot:5168614-Karenia_brevis.AAC.1
MDAEGVDSISKLRTMQSQLQQVKENAELQEVVTNFCNAEVGVGAHVAFLDLEMRQLVHGTSKAASFEDFFKSAISDVERILMSAREAWAAEAKQIQCDLEASIPAQWSMSREQLFSDPIVAQKLLDNREGYARIGKLASRAFTVKDLIKRLHKDGYPPLLDASVPKALSELARDGVEC